MKKIISITLTICMLLANSVVFAKDYTQKFWDVDKSHWAFEAIAELTDRGVINGYNDGSFKPEETISRAEWAKIMIDAAGKDASNNNVYFYDMANHWANKYVNAAEKYLPGTNGGFYLPDQAATREEVTVALVKICGYDKSYDYFGYLTSISDVDTILANNRPYINTAIKNNLISGFDDNTFRGQNSLTRAEATTLLYRAFKNGKPQVERTVDKISDTYKTEVVNVYAGETKNIISTKDNNNNIYVVTEPYVTNNDIPYESNLIKIDLQGKQEQIYDIKNLTFNDNDVILSQFAACGIVYDKNNDRIIVVGHFNYANYIGYNLEDYYIYAIKDKKASFCGSFTTHGASMDVIGTVSNGFIIDVIEVYYISFDCKKIVRIHNAEKKYDYENDGFSGVVDVWDTGMEFYMLTNRGLYKCEYTNDRINAYIIFEIGETNAGNYLDDNMCVVKNLGNITFLNFDGKILKEIDVKRNFEITNSLILDADLDADLDAYLSANIMPKNLTWETDNTGDIHIGNNHISFRIVQHISNSDETAPYITYQGDMLNGVPNGYGIIYQSGDGGYEGEWKNGLPNGWGTGKYFDWKYEGEWKNGLPNGQGVFCISNQTLNGIWENGKFIR